MNKRDKLVPVQERPFNAETPMSALDAPLTPTDHFFVRNHFPVPEIDSETWQLHIDGAVAKPQSFTLAALQALQHKTVAVTLECAGNGRTQLEPRASGTPWAFGAAGTAEFTGVSLTTLLEAAGLDAAVVELLFTGADRGEIPAGETIPYARSLPRVETTRREILLAWSMNGKPLTPDHGYPLRLIVPGWYGVASVKWLTTITALTVPFDGFYQTDHYVYEGEDGVADGTPVDLMRVRSVIATPQDGETKPFVPIEIRGTAWTGSGHIYKVYVSTDGGESWQIANKGRSLSAHAAMPWCYWWQPPGPGRYTIMARAIDSTKHNQPLTQRWNKGGYGNNIVQRVTIEIVA